MTAHLYDCTTVLDAYLISAAFTPTDWGNEKSTKLIFTFCAIWAKVLVLTTLYMRNMNG
tara:strand:+ start:2420 stop:2596 length:177 start_codon:yes stop_codon:yes gene_type:complete